jgi:predicted PurR-regulated permease PerM
VLVVAVLLAIGLASMGLLAVFVLALIRHVKLLASSLRRFQDEVQPILEDIQQQSATAQDKVQRMQDRQRKAR